MPTLAIGRMAPTPSGRLHLGNALAFGAAWLSARSQGGRVLLRFEDIDDERSDPDLEASIREDLLWLGLCWDEETQRQSERSYATPMARLASRLYRCTCTRKDVRATGNVYDGRCRDAGLRKGKIRLRLPSAPPPFVDLRHGRQCMDAASIADPVVGNEHGRVAYPLAVVADDIEDGVTEVVRGGDLLAFTAVQATLYDLLDAPRPAWTHTATLVGSDGRKLSKSHADAAVGDWRSEGLTAHDVWRALLPLLGVPSGIDRLGDAVAAFRPAALPVGPLVAPQPPAPHKSGGVAK